MENLDNARYRNYEHYVREGWSREPKYTFRHVASAAARCGNSGSPTECLDVAWATSELIDHLLSELPNWRFTRIDFFDPLIEKARRLVPEANFVKQSFLDMPANFNGRFDLITAVGVIGLFEDEEAEAFWATASRLLRPGGMVLVLGPLNEFGVDLSIRHRKWMDGQRGKWERGWSIPSRQSVEAALERHFGRWQIEPYDPELDLAPRRDPVRTWTVAYAEKSRPLTNGMKLLVDYSLIEATTPTNADPAGAERGHK